MDGRPCVSCEGPEEGAYADAHLPHTSLMPQAVLPQHAANALHTHPRSPTRTRTLGSRTRKALPC